MRWDYKARDGWLAALVGVALFGAFVAVQRGQIKSYDGSIMVNLATRLLTRHTFTINPATDTLHLQSPYTSYGFGTTLLALPFDALQRALAPRGQSLLTLANPVVLAACGVLLFFIGRQLGWRPRVCVITALGFGLLTPALWQSTEMFSEPGVAFASLLLVLGALSWRGAPALGSLLVGIAAAMAILFRPDSILLILPLALVVPFIVPRDLITTRRALLAVSAPIVAVGTFQLWYNSHRFGSIFDTGISHQARGQGFNTPILEGLDLLLRSPGRGFFWTSPILLIALPGIVLLYRRIRPLAIAIGLVVIGRFVFFAMWFIPGGGVAWGPRLLFPVTALLAIPAGEALEDVARWRFGRPRRVASAGIVILAIVSGIVSLLSIAVGYELYWREWTRVPHALVSQRTNAYYFSLAHNPIVGNVHMLRIGSTLAPIHFRHGPDGVGIMAIGIAALTATIALISAGSTAIRPTTADPPIVLESQPPEGELAPRA